MSRVARSGRYGSYALGNYPPSSSDVSCPPSGCQRTMQEKRPLERRTVLREDRRMFSRGRRTERDAERTERRSESRDRPETVRKKSPGKQTAAAVYSSRDTRL